MNKYIETIKALKPSFLDKTSEIFDNEQVVVKDNYYLFKSSIIYTEAILTLHQYDLKEKIRFILWVHFSAKDFIKMSRNFSKKNQIEATIHDRIPFYEYKPELNVLLQFENSDNIVLPEIVPHQTSFDLYKDYTNGIDESRFMKIQQELGVTL